MNLLTLYFFWLIPLTVHALSKTHEFHFNASLIKKNPDGVRERDVIAINGQWPLPIIRVTRHDRVIIHLTNEMPDRNTSLHFHGLFMNGTNAMDGPEHVTQCPIPPGHTFTYNFTVDDQAGTYWYHSHSGSQYSDGLRGMFIIEEESRDLYPFTFDEEVPLTVCDWYHAQSSDIMSQFLSRYNPTGAEPIPQNSLFNDTRNVTWNVEPDKTYFLRIVNMGMFVSQYLYIENHTFTIVEVDGVYVEPVETESLYITVAQRYGVLLKTKKDVGNEVFRFVNVLDEPMLDLIPDDLQIISTNYLQYGRGRPDKPAPLANGKGKFDMLVQFLDPYDDIKLVPALKRPLYEDFDVQIVLNFTMDNLGDGVNYAFFNDITYTAPKVPTLFSVLSAGKFANNAAIYGSNTNTHVLQPGEVVEIVLNNMDSGKHPFHLHGHVFQTVFRSEGTDDDDNPEVYDPSNSDYEIFPKMPMQRDTVLVNPNGFIRIRFKADNPGVWFFHCHVDWHLEQGLAIVLVEDPALIQKKQAELPVSHLEACEKLNIPTKGNAAARFGDTEESWLDLTGENLQVKPLPPGFTPKGYVAIVACALAAVYGIYTIYIYGMEDVNTENAEHMVQKLYQLLGESGDGESEERVRLNSATPLNENE
uniref:L-ascorbate oxidase n=1 Tax=Candidozyma auris TaxID=498019 RepID=A0A0L0NVV1_CANAR